MPEEPTLIEPTTPAAPVAAPPVDAPWQQSIFTPDGQFVPEWQTKLPADFEEDRALLANFKDLKGITKSLKENMTAARAKPAGLTIPAADAAPEVQAAYQAELKKLYGVPETVDGYKFDKPAALPEGVEWSDDAAKAFANKAHELGLTPQQAQALVQYDMDRLTGATAAQQAEAAQLAEYERGEMAKRWGDKVDTHLSLAARLATTMNLPNARELFDPKSPLFAGVDMTAAFAQLAGQLGEAKLVSGAAVANLGPEQLAKSIMGDKSNPEHEAFRNASHPNSAAVRAKVAALWKQASAGQ